MSQLVLNKERSTIAASPKREVIAEPDCGGQIAQELTYYNRIAENLSYEIDNLLHALSPICVYEYASRSVEKTAERDVPDLAPLACQLHTLTTSMEESLDNVKWLLDHIEL